MPPTAATFLAGSIATAALIAQTESRADGTEVGALAPDFALPDLAGTVHRLHDLRGKIAVLEWTNHACPAVAHGYDTRAIPKTLAAVRGDDLVWWTVDSGQGCAEQRDAIGDWRAQVGHERPYLLDPGGAVGRAFGATRTPHLFVIARDGTLAYAGALTDRDDEVNYVEAAVAALRGNRAVAHARTAARGCEIDYADTEAVPAPAAAPPAAPPAPALAAWSAFQSAAMLARAGKIERAVATVAASFEQGYAAPSDVLSWPAFAPLRADDAARARLRALLRTHARETRVTMVAPEEPGSPMLLFGRVHDRRGQPVPGALVYAYQTDERGIYSASGDDNPRLFALVRTDSDGCFALRTVRPAAYPDEQIDQHVHFEIESATHPRSTQRLGFADDPLWRARPPEERPWVWPVERGADGLDRCSFVLKIR